MNTPKIVLIGTKLNSECHKAHLLGQPVFLLHVNDLPYIINNISKTFLFADDIVLYFLNLIPLIMPQN